MRWQRLAAIALVVCGAWTTGAAQVAQVACASDAQALPLVALFGTWEARIDGIDGVGAVRLARHPEYAGVRGTIARGGATAQLAGDIDDEGLLSIDESQDGLSISAVWSGRLLPGACGNVFEGTWRRAGDEQAARFVLRKTSPAETSHPSEVKP